MNLRSLTNISITLLTFASVSHADPVAQQAVLRAPNPAMFNQFGTVIDLDGDTLITGTNTFGRNAAAHVYVREGETWRLQDSLQASNFEEGDSFGITVAIDGDTAVIGAVGESSASQGVNGDESDNSAENSGAVYVFVREGNTWTQQAYLKASNAEAGDVFGSQVAIDGDTLVVGANHEDSASTGVSGDQSDNSAEGAGAAYVFVRDGSEWSQQAYLKASNTDAGDRFSLYGMDIDRDTIVIGANGEASASNIVNGDESDNSAEFAGAAYVFVRSGNEWSQQAYLKPSKPGPRAGFGLSAAVSGDSIVVTAHEEDEFAGAAYVFVREDGQWREQARLKASNAETWDLFAAGLGQACAIEGNAVIIGASGESSAARGVNGNGSNNSLELAGAAYVFTRSGESWTQQAYLKSANPRMFGEFGWSVALSKGTAVIGALETENASGGSATIFTLGDLVSGNGLEAAAVAAGLFGPDALPEATPFNDGVSNLLKYAFNMNLAGPDVHVLRPGTGTSGLPHISVNSDGTSRILRYEFLRRVGSELVYTPMVSESLVLGSWVPIPESPEIIPVNAEWERVIYEHAVAKSEGKRFGVVHVQDDSGE